MKNKVKRFLFWVVFAIPYAIYLVFASTLVFIVGYCPKGPAGIIRQFFDTLIFGPDKWSLSVLRIPGARRLVWYYTDKLPTIFILPFSLLEGFVMFLCFKLLVGFGIFLFKADISDSNLLFAHLIISLLASLIIGFFLNKNKDLLIDERQKKQKTIMVGVVNVIERLICGIIIVMIFSLGAFMLRAGWFFNYFPLAISFLIGIFFPQIVKAVKKNQKV